MKLGIVIPVYNHAQTVGDVLGKIHALLPEIAIIAVNDGSTDGTPEALTGVSNLIVLTHTKNQGKGRALLTAFQHAASAGFTHVATIDADNQHDPADLASLIRLVLQHPDDLLIGMRDMDAPNLNIPKASKKGRDAARFWLRVQTGQDIPDSQCGLRVYPLKYVLTPHYRFLRFDFETEILARMAWGGLRIRSVPIRCIYFTGNARVSHFRPFIDTIRGIRVNIFLVLRRLAPFPFRKLIRYPEHEFHFGKWWKPATWRRAFRHALRANSSNTELSTAFALGVFIGLTPFYMLQTFITIFFAKRLHLNMIAAVLGSQISIPPVAPLWFFLSLATGNLLLHGQWIHEEFQGSVWQWLWRGKWPFLLGNFIVAIVVAVLSYFLCRIMLALLRQKGGQTASGFGDSVVNRQPL